jgi:hypothetical protein
MADANITTHTSRELLNATLLRRRDTRFKRNASCRALPAHNTMRHSSRTSWQASHRTCAESPATAMSSAITTTQPARQSSQLRLRALARWHVGQLPRPTWPCRRSAAARLEAGSRCRQLIFGLGLKRVGCAPPAPVPGDRVGLSW